MKRALIAASAFIGSIAVWLGKVALVEEGILHESAIGAAALFVAGMTIGILIGRYVQND